eukprot:479341_1
MARRRPRMRRGPTQMEQMMQMMMMMKMMFPDKHSKKMGHVHKMCRYYTCIVKTQQSQLSQLMNMMMMSANVNQAPITITDNTKSKSKSKDRRRIMEDINDRLYGMHIIGVKKCKMLYNVEICVTFDSINNIITMDYTVKNKKDIKNRGYKKNVSYMSDPVTKMKSLMSVFENVLSNNNNNIPIGFNDDIIEEYEEDFDDI